MGCFLCVVTAVSLGFEIFLFISVLLDFSQVRLSAIGVESNQFRIVGRVDYNNDGVWGSLCADDWDDVDAQTVCRQIGLNNGG